MKLAFFSCILCSTLLSLPLEAREVRDLSGKGWTFQFTGEPSEKVSIPHTWNAQDGANGNPSAKKVSALSAQGDGYKRGVASYTRTLPINPEAGKRYFLHFEGASVVTHVSVNDKPAGKHEGAFTAFCFEVTDLLQKKGNTLTVITDNTQTNYIAPMAGDFTTFGGLYRPVSLMETGSLCIQPDYYASPGVFITPEVTTDNQGLLKIKTRLSSNKKENTQATLSFTLLDPKGKKVAQKTVPTEAKTGVTEVITELEVKNPELWQARENPALYSLLVELKGADKSSDALTQPVGFRKFSVDPDKGFILNGKAMQIRGVNRHQDKEGKGWALSAQDEKKDMELIYNMGTNGLRTAHYPQSERIYDFCDKKGIIVWSEVPLVEKIFDTPAFRENIKNQATEMVLQHYNHPSVFFWGVFNEIYHQCGKEIQGINMEAELKTVNNTLKALDAQRLTICATNRIEKAELNHITDILCANGYPGWYGGGPQGMGGFIASFNKKYPNRAFGISEYGHGASIHHHESPAKQPSPFGYWHPEEWQAIGHEENYKKIKAAPEKCWGSFIWNMFDFATDERNEGERAGMNDKGLVTYDRNTPKDAYFFYKANWNTEPLVYLTSKRFKERQQEVISVKGYSNAQEVTLTVNGKSLGSQKPNEVCVVEWKEVSLKPGKNTVTLSTQKDGKTLKDSATWNYTPSQTPVTSDKYDSFKKKP